MFPAETYDNSFFRENGFHRIQCPSGPWFWSQDPETVYSGIQPDVEYTFIGRQVFNGRYTLAQCREKAVAFFARHGHTAMASYPVLASLWRNDLLFTAASICDFQPHVISRELLPPANPLVVAQKCVRLNDLENIGRSGRHLSSFTMLGHHAFNFEDEDEIYWIPRTVELCHKFYVEEFGADPMKLTYVEAAWAGGGNAGPCVEVIYEGIEVATLVFMSLEEDPEGEVDIKGVKYAPMPTRVVDTGYGLERLVWASQGTSNIYTAVSPEFVQKLVDVTGFPMEGGLIDDYFTKMSSEDIETPLDYERIQKKIAAALGVEPKALARAVRPAETILTLCDFTRTLLLMLNDHVLPSNKDAGYLVRHLAKRIMTMLTEEKIPLSGAEVIGMQFDCMVGDFPELEGKRETAVDIMAIEQERHGQTMERGRNQLLAEIKKLTKKKSKVFPEKKIFFYYDTLGLPLPYIREVVEEESELELEISDDFWDKFFNQSMALEKGGGKSTLPRGQAPTAKLYYEDPYARSADARVTKVHEDWVALDQTVFYPDGGGQPGDQGTLTLGSDVFNVIDTKFHDGTIYHRLGAAAPAELLGEAVKAEIDWERRYTLMRAHSSTHLLNATLKKVLGFHVRQMGAQKGVDASRYDIAHYKNVGPAEIQEIEGRINEAIFAGSPITTEVMPRGAAENKYGFFIYQGGFVPFDQLRIVTIDGIDTEACAGTHLRDIQEASLFKLLGVSQIQNNVYRFRYTVGAGALAQFQEAETALGEITKILGSSRDVTVSKIEKLTAEAKEMSKRLGDYEATLIEAESKAARVDVAGGPTRVFFRSVVPKDTAMRHIIRMVRSGKNQVFFAVFKDGAVLARSKDVDVNFRDHQGKFAALDVLRAGPDMVVFGGTVEPGAAWDAARSILA
jgi:alanyl-tRNA synthetase